jgi:hypothetical protein
MVCPEAKVRSVPPAELVRLLKAASASEDVKAVKSIRSAATAKSVMMSAPPLGA